MAKTATRGTRTETNAKFDISSVANKDTTIMTSIIKTKLELKLEMYWVFKFPTLLQTRVDYGLESETLMLQESTPAMHNKSQHQINCRYMMQHFQLPHFLSRPENSQNQN